MKKSNRYPTSRTGAKGSPAPEREAKPNPRPGTITSVQSQVHDPERVSIFVDGEFALGVARDVAEALGLDKGRELDETMIAEILAREEFHQSTTIALNFLAYRPRSEGEIRSRLQRAGMPEATIEMTMARLRDWHYVDDADFARRWIENRIAHRPRGARLLSQELKHKGIAPEVMSEALEDAEIDEHTDALSIARTRSRQLADLELPIRERRISGFLARRGYGYDVIRSTLATLRDESGNEEEIEPE